MDTHTVVLLFFLILPAGLAVGLAKLQCDALKTLRWHSVTGRILLSRAVARDVRSRQHSYFGSGDTRGKFVSQEQVARRHFAEIEYEYSVGGRRLRGRRVGLGQDGGDFEVTEMLRRYPVGASVQVLDNPRDPLCAILERPPLGRIVAGWLAILFLAGLIAGLVYGVDSVASALRAAIPRPDRTPLVVFLAGFATALALFAAMIFRNGRQAKAWPRVPGQIVVSRVETRLRTEHLSGSRRIQRITMYTPRVIYAFEVGGIGFQGENLGWIAASNSDAGAKQTVGRWPVGMPVTVSYNPENPTDSTLSPGAGLLPAVLCVLAIIFALAATWAAGS